MPHQCVKCGKFYDDNSEEILKGCSCGGKVFFYVKKSKAELLEKEDLVNLSKKEKEQIEKDVYDIIGNEIDHEKPIILDLESIKIKKPGKYELDLMSLFKKKQPLIYKLDEGKYMVDLIETFKNMKKRKK